MEIVIQIYRRRLRRILDFVALACIYAALARGGLYLASINAHASPFWPAAGFAVAVTHLFGFRAATAVFFAATCVNYLVPTPLHVAAAIGLGNAAGAFVGAWILSSLISRRSNFEDQALTIAVACAAMGGPAVSAALGTLALAVHGIVPWSTALDSMVTWYVGDLIGCFTVVPLVLCFSQKSPPELRPILRLHACIVICACIALLLLSPGSGPYIVLLYPLLSMMAIFGTAITLFTSVFLTVAAASLLTLLGRGPFVLSSLNDNLMHLQIFAVSLSLTAIAVRGFRNSRRMAPIAAVALAGWTGTALLANSFREQVGAEEHREITLSISRSEQGLKEKLETYLTAIDAGKGFFAASEKVSREEWRSFAGNLDVIERFPGMRGLGVIANMGAVGAERLPGCFDFETRSLPIRAVPGSSRKPGEPTYPILAIEPIESNKQALALDLATEPTRRAALEEARDSGQTAITAPIKLVQDEKARSGYLMVSPFYAGSGVPQTLEERRERLLGWTYAPFVAAEFFEGIEALSGLLALEVWDPAHPDEPVYSSGRARPEASPLAEGEIKIGRRALRLSWLRNELSFPSADTRHSWALGAGSLLTLALALMVANLQLVRERAEQLATKRLAELTEQRAMALNAARLASLGVMAGGVAHEINNPLAVVISRTERLKVKLGRLAVLPAVEKDLEIILRTSGRIATIVRGLRTFARDGDADPLQPARLVEIVNDTLALCQERFLLSGVALSVGEVPDIVIQCRAAQISQVLLNLLNNAFDAVLGTTDPTVNVIAAVVGGTMELSVVDSGPGVPLEIRDRIMEPFFTTKEVGSGTGLGLPISKGIAAEHAGTLVYDATSTRTRFVLTIPIDSREMTSAA